jgi:hypothetical protein
MHIAPYEYQDATRREKTQTHLNTNYFGPVYPEAPKFKGPQEDLMKLGIRKVWGFKKERL